MMRTTILFLILFFAALLTGCGPRPIYKISSLEEEIDYYEGNEYVSKTDSSSHVYIEYMHQTYPHFVFYLQIENLSDSIMIIDPSKSVIKNYYSKSWLDDNSLNSISFAVNPQARLDRVNSRISARETNHGISTACNCIGGLFAVASDVTSDDDNSSEVEDWIEMQEQENIDYENDMENLNSEKDFWQNEVLLKGALQPGEVIGGQIFFKRDNDTEFFKTLIILEKSKFEFLYRQEQID